MYTAVNPPIEAWNTEFAELLILRNAVHCVVTMHERAALQLDAKLNPAPFWTVSRRLLRNLSLSRMHARTGCTFPLGALHERACLPLLCVLSACAKWMCRSKS